MFLTAAIFSSISAELMKLKFVHSPSVRVRIISEPNAWISFNFWLLLPLGYALGCIFNLKKMFF